MSGGGTETFVGYEAATSGGDKKRDSLGTTGSPAHLIIKDLGEIHSRLLDHRPVIQGETRYFVKEFEGGHLQGTENFTTLVAVHVFLGKSLR
uniref:Biogenesis of lysosome-related organelles complex 1 subunit 5 n=1 Tax=Equus caballus TaxID=9796 RepID=A0A9L0R652_HORSE